MNDLPLIIHVEFHAPTYHWDKNDHNVTVTFCSRETGATWIGYMHRSYYEFEVFRRKLSTELLKEFDRVTDAKTQYDCAETRRNEAELTEDY